MRAMEERLSFASYAKCLKAAMKSPYDKQIKLTELLLEFLIIPDAENEEYNAYDKNGETVVVDKTMASNLFNNKENIHSSIQKNCDLDIVIDGIKGYFEEYVVPSISAHLMGDLIRNMREIIDADTDISEVKKKEFLERAEENDVSGFLSSVFLYAVKKENKLGKQVKGDSLKTSNANEQYCNSFIENLFLHREEGSKTVRLKDLFVMPKYEEILWSEKRKGDNAVNYISEFAARIIEGERRQGEILFIEGDAGVGKTSLVSYLAYLYIEENKEWKRLFQNKTLLCIRLRDIIPEGMKFSRDTIVDDIFKYLKLSSIDEFKELYKNPLVVLDGFDELCMVERISEGSENYISQIFSTFRNYKIIITTRPQYLDVKRLDIRKKHIVLQHFDDLQRREWIDNYRKTGILEYEKAGMEYILDENNEEIDSICDTPMIMYMIVAGGINEEAKHNKWALYHQIFYKELSDTEYNSIFFNRNGIYSHGIKKYQDLLYRLSTEISYRMFCSGNMKIFLTEQEIKNTVNDLKIEDIKLKKVVQHCYALCNYWKPNGKGAVEFYHNNIRDFFLCEKIFYEFNSIYHECEEMNIQKVTAYITERIYSLFRYMIIPDKAVEFLYLRTMYHYEHHNMMDFSAKEYEKRYLQHFFSDMLQYGGVIHYDRDSGENVYNNMINVLANTVRIYRYILELNLADNEYITWFDNPDEINRANLLSRNFREIFFNISDYHDMTLSCRANFKGIQFHGTDLRFVNFCDSNLENTSFVNSNLQSVELKNANLHRANMAGENLSKLVLISANLSDAYLVNADLSGADLSNTDLSNAKLFKANLNNANLSNARLDRANLSRAKLQGANLSDAHLHKTCLSNVNLCGANLCGASLSNVDLFKANLNKVNLRNANIVNPDLRNAILPDGFISSNQIVQLEHLKRMEIPGLMIKSYI